MSRRTYVRMDGWMDCIPMASIGFNVDTYTSYLPVFKTCPITMIHAYAINIHLLTCRSRQ